MKNACFLTCFLTLILGVILSISNAHSAGTNQQCLNECGDAYDQCAMEAEATYLEKITWCLGEEVCVAEAQNEYESDLAACEQKYKSCFEGCYKEPKLEPVFGLAFGGEQVAIPLKK